MPFSFDKRGCHIEGHVNGRSEEHGDEPVSAADLRVGSIMIDKDELNTLCDDEEMYRSLFNTKGKPVEPRHKVLENKFYGVHKYTKCLVTFYVGPDMDAIKLNGCKIKSIELVPQTGGLTEMSMTVQCTPTKEDFATLWDNMDRDASISARFGKAEVKSNKAQPELPLGDAPEPDDRQGSLVGDGEGAPATH